jgi:glycogen debranching enzyme
MPHAAAYCYIVCNRNEEQACKKMEELLKRHNGEWKGRVEDMMKSAMKSFEGEMRYFKLEKGRKRISAENPLVERYFRELDNQERSQVAHNGWIMNANPLEDFAMVGWHYLDRSINIWSDSVKLRFGDCPADSPYLWEHISKYVHDMAMIFDGFRLDNAHSTPIHVAYYML